MQKLMCVETATKANRGFDLPAVRSPVRRASRNLPPLRTCSSEQALPCSQAHAPRALARSSSSSALGTSGFGASRPLAMQSLLAAARTVDPRELPAGRELPPSLRQSKPAQLSSWSRHKQHQFDTNQFDNAAVELHTSCVGAPTTMTPSSSLAAKLPKLSKEDGKRHRTWSIPEASKIMNNELERLGQPRQNMKWASPEIENFWLRREVTTQLLHTLVSAENNGVGDKGGKRPLSAETETSTNAPNSMGNSGRDTPNTLPSR